MKINIVKSNVSGNFYKMLNTGSLVRIKILSHIFFQREDQNQIKIALITREFFQLSSRTAYRLDALDITSLVDWLRSMCFHEVPSSPRVYSHTVTPQIMPHQSPLPEVCCKTSPGLLTHQERAKTFSSHALFSRSSFRSQNQNIVTLWQIFQKSRWHTYTESRHQNRQPVGFVSIWSLFFSFPILYLCLTK